MRHDDERWEIGGRFVVSADSQEEAEHALRAIERVAKRVKASVDIYVHVNEPVHVQG
jgi:hypothetical protein